MTRLAAIALVVAGLALAGAPAAKKPKSPGKKAAASASASASKKKDGGSGSLELGTLEFEIKGDFTVSLDGKELGRTPLKPVTVLAGKHQLRLVNAEAKIDHTEEVDVQAGQHSTFQISLE